jgi:hypothetical protein
MKLSKPVTGGLNSLLIADYPRFSFHFLIKFFTVEELTIAFRVILEIIISY